jgi:phosphopantetheinyl transferase (holo-ACP synthase)
MSGATKQVLAGVTVGTIEALLSRWSEAVVRDDLAAGECASVTDPLLEAHFAASAWAAEEAAPKRKRVGR